MALVELEKRDLQKPVTPEAPVYPRMVVIAPDGAQGAKLKIALGNEEDSIKLREVFQTASINGLPFTVKTVQPLIEKSGLKRVDI